VNLYEWSSIGRFPSLIYNAVINVFNESEDREQKNNLTTKLAKLQIVLETHCEVSVKYDGTNLGKDKNGNFYGRRYKLDANIKKYQGVSLVPLYEIDVAAILADLLREVRDSPKVVETGAEFPDPEDFVVIGELMKHVDLFDYKEKNLKGTWQMCGLQFICSSEEAGIATRKALNAAGYRVAKWDSNGKEPAEKVRVGLGHKLCQLFERHNLPHPPIVATCSVAQVVLTMRDWMVEAKGEGVIIIFEGDLKKWKLARYISPVLREQHKTALKLLDEHKDLIDKNVPILPQVLQALSDVADSPASIVKPKRKKRPSRGPLDPNEVERAIASASTKFDSPEVFFQQGRGEAVNVKPKWKRCAKKYVDLLTEEVISSGDLPNITDEGRKQVEKTVFNHVTRDFRKWVKSLN